MTKVLITGAAGMIAGELRKRLAPQFSLRLTDIEPITNLSSREEFVAADLADMAAVERLMEGVSGIIHLGGVSAEDTWDKIMPANVGGTWRSLRGCAASRREAHYRRVQQSCSGIFPAQRDDRRYGLSAPRRALWSQ